MHTLLVTGKIQSFSSGLSDSKITAFFPIYHTVPIYSKGNIVECVKTWFVFLVMKNYLTLSFNSCVIFYWSFHLFGLLCQVTTMYEKKQCWPKAEQDQQAVAVRRYQRWWVRMPFIGAPRWRLSWTLSLQEWTEKWSEWEPYLVPASNETKCLRSVSMGPGPEPSSSALTSY